MLVYTGTFFQSCSIIYFLIFFFFLFQQPNRLITVSRCLLINMGLIDSPGQFASKTYDYVIIGGGTAGLVLAARLTEDPNVTVGVLEAGQNRLADPNILVPGCKVNDSFSITTN